MTRLVWSWLRLSGLAVVGGVPLLTVHFGSQAAHRATAVPGLHYDVPSEAIVPVLVALGSVAGLVEGWPRIRLLSSRPAWCLPAVRFVGTVAMCGLPWLMTIRASSSQQILTLVLAGVAVAALLVGLLGRYAWLPLLLIGYVFLDVATQHPGWFFWPHWRVAVLVLVVGGALYVGIGVRRATP